MEKLFNYATDYAAGAGVETLLIAAFVMFFIGGVIVADFLWRQFAGYKADAVFDGILVRGYKNKKPEDNPTWQDFESEMYYQVFSFKGPDGADIQAVERSSQNWLPRLDIGDTVPVTAKRGNLEDISRRGLFWPVFGFIMLFASFGLVALAVTMSKGALYFLGILVGLVVTGALKLKSYIKPRAEWDTPESFRAKRDKIWDDQIKSMHFLEPGEIVMRREARDKIMRYWRWGGRAFLLGLLCWALYAALQLK